MFGAFESTADHVPGTTKHPANYVPCRGGYKEDWYQCMECGIAYLDEKGQPLEWFEPITDKHTPGKIKHLANYTICGGGYKEDYYHCTDCGAVVNSDGYTLDFFSAKTNIHTPGIETFPANYNTCNGGYKNDYHKCIYCGQAVGADGEYVPWYGGRRRDHVSKENDREDNQKYLAFLRKEYTHNSQQGCLRRRECSLLDVIQYL